MWQIEIRHEGLHKYRVIKGTDRFVVEQKAAAQRAIWNSMWASRIERARKAADKESAQERTQEAHEILKGRENLLKDSLQIGHAIDWDSLKDKSKFSTPKPDEPMELVLRR